MPGKSLYTVKDVSQKLGVSSRTMWRYINNNQIEYCNLSPDAQRRQIRFTEEHIVSFIEKNNSQRLQTEKERRTELKAARKPLLEEAVPPEDWTMVNEWIHSQRSPHTKRAYKRDITLFYNFIDGKSIDSVTLTELQDYEEKLAKEHPTKSAMRAQMLTAIKSLMTFGQKTGKLQLSDNIRTILRLPQRKEENTKRRSKLSEEQQQELVSLYQQGVKVKDLEKQYSFSDSSIYAILTKHLGYERPKKVSKEHAPKHDRKDISPSLIEEIRQERQSGLSFRKLMREYHIGSKKMKEITQGVTVQRVDIPSRHEEEIRDGLLKGEPVISLSRRYHVYEKKIWRYLRNRPDIQEVRRLKTKKVRRDKT